MPEPSDLELPDPFTPPPGLIALRIPADRLRRGDCLLLMDPVQGGKRFQEIESAEVVFGTQLLVRFYRPGEHVLGAVRMEMGERDGSMPIVQVWRPFMEDVPEQLKPFDEDAFREGMRQDAALRGWRTPMLPADVRISVDATQAQQALRDAAELTEVVRLGRNQPRAWWLWIVPVFVVVLAVLLWWSS